MDLPEVVCVTRETIGAKVRWCSTCCVHNRNGCRWARRFCGVRRRVRAMVANAANSPRCNGSSQVCGIVLLGNVIGNC